MFTITLECSNETVLNARHEIQKFKDFETERMAGGNSGEGHATASSGYVLICKLERAIDAELERRFRAEREVKFSRALRGPSIREQRKVG